MWEDPSVAEIHRTREKLAAEYNYDIAAFFADLRKRQAALGSRLVPVPQKKRAEPTADSDRGGQTGSTGAACSEAAPAA